jgi:hypothetical protein
MSPDPDVRGSDEGACSARATGWKIISHASHPGSHAAWAWSGCAFHALCRAHGGHACSVATAVDIVPFKTSHARAVLRPPREMELILQTAFGLVFRGFLRVLGLARTRTGAAMLGLAEAALVHSDVRAPQRSDGAAHDLWEVEAYVGILFRLAIDLFFEGIQKAALVGLCIGVGIVVLDVLLRPPPPKLSRPSSRRPSPIRMERPRLCEVCTRILSTFTSKTEFIQ